MSKAALTHKFRKLRSPTKCRDCEGIVVFQGVECEEVRFFWNITLAPLCFLLYTFLLPILLIEISCNYSFNKLNYSVLSVILYFMYILSVFQTLVPCNSFLLRYHSTQFALMLTVSQVSEPYFNCYFLVVPPCLSPQVFGKFSHHLWSSETSRENTLIWSRIHTSCKKGIRWHPIYTQNMCFRD